MFAGVRARRNCSPKNITLSSIQCVLVFSENCKPGYKLLDTKPGGKRICTKCEIGFYQPEFNVDYSCLACPDNKTTMDMGSSIETDCILCEYGNSLATVLSRELFKTVDIKSALSNILHSLYDMVCVPSLKGNPSLKSYQHYILV